ncbi:MAG: hypothetical protein GY932_08020 [Arcobacter sp.]|nr:hypothetical protein [Arcobacter sp.]
MNEYKLITCLMKEHTGRDIVVKLKEKNIITANLSFARGNSINHHTVEMEMELLTVLVEESMADEIFDYLFYECKFNEQHTGMIYQTSIGKSSKYTVN